MGGWTIWRWIRLRARCLLRLIFLATRGCRNCKKGQTIRTSRTELAIGQAGWRSDDGFRRPARRWSAGSVLAFNQGQGCEPAEPERRRSHHATTTATSPWRATSAATLGNLDLTTHHGDVHLRLPPKASFQYQVVTRHGDISSDFENVRSESHTGASSASGAVGKGGVKINVTSDTGDIEISKAEAPTTAAPPEPPAEPAAPARPVKPGKAGRKVADVEVM